MGNEDKSLSEEDAAIRRKRLSSIKEGPRVYSARYSRFVRSLRLILPLAAVIIIAIVFIWSDKEKRNLVQSQDIQPAPKTIGKNELLEPRFESKDEKQQPYTITATRAVQGEGDEGLLILEQPVADVLLKSGSWIAIEAEQGAYREDIQRLVLNGNVQMFHDLGYQFETSQLHVDLDKNLAWSEVDVYAQGPAGTLEAKGMKADGEEDRLIFAGPAKVVLNKSVTGLN